MAWWHPANSCIPLEPDSPLDFEALSYLRILSKTKTSLAQDNEGPSSNSDDACGSDLPALLLSFRASWDETSGPRGTTELTAETGTADDPVRRAHRRQ